MRGHANCLRCIMVAMTLCIGLALAAIGFTEPYIGRPQETALAKRVVSPSGTSAISATPDCFGLDQNTPNPFNPSTTIRYQLPEGRYVRLVVYNIRGQAVRILVDESMAAGYYAVNWDGTDHRSQQVSSGIYLYRMQAGSFVQVGRMVLLK